MSDLEVTPEVKAIIQKMISALTLKEADTLVGYFYEDDFGTTEEYFLGEFETQIEAFIHAKAQEE